MSDSLTTPQNRAEAERLASALVAFLGDDDHEEHPDDREAVILDILAALQAAEARGRDKGLEETIKIIEQHSESIGDSNHICDQIRNLMDKKE